MHIDKNQITITEEESKICKLDNKKFESSRKMMLYVKSKYNLTFEQYIIKAYYNDVRPVCLKTGNFLKFKGNKLGPWFSNYSKNNFPRKKHTTETKLKIKENTEKAIKKKYNTNNVFSQDWCKEKIKETNLQRYGVENYMQTTHAKNQFKQFIKSDFSKEKTKLTNIKKYGKSHLFKTLKYKQSLRFKFIKQHYNNDWNYYNQKISELLNVTCLTDFSNLTYDQPLKFKCLMCNHIWEEPYLLIPNCESCKKSFKNCRSNIEKSIAIWLNSQSNLELKTNSRFNYDGKTYEADILIPSKKLIIELNGLYWHSELNGKKDKYYHKNKLDFFNKLGYDVVNIFEDEWIFKEKIIKSKLMHKLHLKKYKTTHARKCQIHQIKNKNCVDFLNNNHLQGHINSSICYGAYINDKLVAVMTFSKQRKFLNKNSNASNTFELVRFATDSNLIITGIANRILKKFINDVHPNCIISYADKRFTSKNSNIYQKLHFNLVSHTEPNYWYTKKLLREYRYKFTKQKLINQGNDPSLSEWQIMQNNGYDRIWDCGHLKYELIIH